MTVRDLSISVRQAVVSHLRDFDALTAIVPPELIFGEFATSDAPTFIRLGDALTTGFEASCWSGSSQDFTIDAFAQGPGRDAVRTICARIVDAMEAFEPAFFGMPELQWVDTIVLPDDVPERLHGVVRYQVTAIMVD